MTVYDDLAQMKRFASKLLAGEFSEEKIVKLMQSIFD
jgi:hypothetical protein